MSISLFLTDGGAAESCSSGGNYLPIMLVLLGLIFVVMFIIPMFQKKKDKEKLDLRDTLSEGDVIITIGGIVGTVISVNTTPTGKQFTIETGEEGRKSTMTFDIQALYNFISRGEVYLAKKAEEDAKKAEEERIAAQEKAAKKGGKKGGSASLNPEPSEDLLAQFDEDNGADA